ncbi:MAG: aminotransferase class V-fold PLP-dependent enzyme, partial [Vallitaleaceae bacterium]|nr:aminotransferase class V-fold PLP-dependent enzyme [Vallitaleaceae bacterium]
YDFSEKSLEKINEQTLLVAFSFMSNVSGRILPAQEVIHRAREKECLILGDACQFIAHHPLSVKEFDVDFLVFSGHKMFGPTGIGVLYGKESVLKNMPPLRYGGDMIEYVYEQESIYLEAPQRFEAGTPNIDGVVGLGAAVDFILDYGQERMQSELKQLREFALQELKKVDHIRILEEEAEAGPVISFLVDEVHPHDVASILDQGDICIRAGHHCAQPLMRHFNVVGSNRISLQIYNDEKEILYFVERLKEVRRWLGYGA